MSRTKGSRNGFTKYPGKYKPVGTPAKNDWQRRGNKTASEGRVVNGLANGSLRTANLSKTGMRNYMNKLGRDNSKYFAGEGEATNRVLNGSSRYAKINNPKEVQRYYNTVAAREARRKKELHEATNKAAAASRLRNSHSDIGNALRDARDDARSFLKRLAKGRDSFGKTVRETADNFVSDTADFYKGAYRKAANKANRTLFNAKAKWRAGMGKSIRDTADNFVSDTIDFYKRAFRKKKR